MLEPWEKEALKEFLVEVYGASARNWPMNEKVFDLTYKMVADANECSEVIDLLPRPMPPGAQPIKWLTKQVRQIFLRALKEKKTRLTTCTNPISAHRKYGILVASMAG